MTANPPLAERLRPWIELLYPERTDACLAEIVELVTRHAPPAAAQRGWDQRDVILITYGDQIRAPGEHPLHTLGDFLVDRGLDRLISTVHLLPFFPYSSDDGFSVIDYRQVDPALGDWSDVRRLSESFRLMFDLVLNHISSQSDWFKSYLAGETPFFGFFIEADPNADLSQVTRPRSLPLLTEFATSRGPRHVWTTFSDDQIDLNFAEPAVLIEMIDILLLYLRQGAQVVRLDAIAYLWKQIGTTCIHLPQTHAVVKVFREIFNEVAPRALLLTETNVPHEENVSYFGAGDEAHLVYQFSLPPLLLDAYYNADARPLANWLRDLAPAPPGAGYFNFTASHDGVGVRPLEGLVSPSRLETLVREVKRRGGMVSTRKRADGGDSPYELNISYFDALGVPGEAVELHVKRFLASQAIMLALRGIPGVYFHSLVGTPNDKQGVRDSGAARRINRHKYELDELNAALAGQDSPQARVFAGFRKLLAARIAQPAFHPQAEQRVIDVDDPAVLCFSRTSLDAQQQIIAAVNFGAASTTIAPDDLRGRRVARNLLSGAVVNETGRISLQPFEAAWFELEQ